MIVKDTDPNEELTLQSYDLEKICFDREMYDQVIEIIATTDEMLVIDADPGARESGALEIRAKAVRAEARKYLDPMIGHPLSKVLANHHYYSPQFRILICENNGIDIDRYIEIDWEESDLEQVYMSPDGFKEWCGYVEEASENLKTESLPENLRLQ